MRSIKPYYRNYDGWWYACSVRFKPVSGSDRVKLVKAPNDSTGEAEAENALRLLLSRLDQDAAKDGMTIDHLCRKYLDWLRRAGNKGQPVKPKSLRSTRDFLATFTRRYGGLTVAVFNACPCHYLDQWLAAHPTWKASDSRRKAIASVKAMFNYGHRFLGQSKPEVRQYESPSATPRITYFTLDQERAILDCCRSSRFADRGEFAEFFSALVETGARTVVEAAEGFTAENIHWQDGNPVAFDLGIIKGRRRYVWLTPAMRALVLRRLDQVKRGPLFLNGDGKPWMDSTVQSRFRRIRDYLIKTQPELGLTTDHVLYSARHTFIVRRLEATKGDVGLVAELAGNSVAVLEKHYKKWCANNDRLMSALGC